ncbi:MAG: class A beta-lactamase-related serine hydrolase [Paramuribaculum sp.]|nr:class A beta-lactamase-related serine hydrolase [Paramuribaculum sp.]
MHRIFLSAAAGVIAMLAVVACGSRHYSSAGSGSALSEQLSLLRDDLAAVADSVSGEVGIALILWNGDTLTVNNSDSFPLMSVFKLHQALALCHKLETHGVSIDTLVRVDRSTLNPDTWSPMLKELTDEAFDISARDLMRFTLVKSDNNASNLMFERFVTVEETDRFISTLVPRNGFQIRYSEAEMQKKHSLSYENRSSPLSVAMLIKKVFSDSILSADNQQFIRETLFGCATGTDRISLPLVGIDGVRIAHKTGSGYRDAGGRLIAHNDAAFIMMPDNRDYTLVVFVKDFDGDESEASAVISEISSRVYRFVTGTFTQTETKK